MQTQPNQLPNFSDHARLRMAQRNLTAAQVALVLQHGQMYHRANALHVYLRRKDILRSKSTRQQLRLLEGVTVILSKDASTVVTLWRNRESGLKRIKKKKRYGW